MDFIHRSRRAVVAAIAGGTAAALVFLRDDHADLDADARRKHRGHHPLPEGPCSEDPSRNKCSRHSQCCTEFCDKGIGRCRYKALGESCTGNIQCRPSRVCLDSICSMGPTATPASSPSPTATSTGTPTSTATSTPTITPTPVIANVTSFGTYGSGNGNFFYPLGVSIADNDTTIAVSDSINNRVSIWTRPDTSSTAWTQQTTFGTQGTGLNKFDIPRWGVLTGNGLTILVTDFNNYRISVWTRPDAASTSWTASTVFGSSGGGASQFASPESLAISADQCTLYVADQTNNRIAIWNRPNSSSTNWTELATVSVTAAVGLSLFADELTLAVSCANLNQVKILTRPDTGSTTWTQTASFGGAGSASDQFQSPYGLVATTNMLKLFIADMSNNRISVWTRPTTSSTTWTNLTTFGSYGSGAANFSNPNSVTLGSSDSILYICEATNNRISIWQV